MAYTMIVPEATDLALYDNNRYLGLNFLWQHAVFNYLKDYNYNGLGPMPIITYNAPDFHQFVYKSTNSEIEIDGVAYSSCSWSQKRAFLKWMRQFIKFAILEYSSTYNV